MTAYYNEHDLKTAAWLRELIKAGLITAGEVDERSIEDIQASDLTGFTQCHFFAGIGVWSYALRRAGWADDHAVWTGSCPCQPFSASGQRGGFSDTRHLWPAWHRLIAECRPDVLFGEQVASKDGLAWFDIVSADLEGTGYAVGACDLCAAGVGAPHIRQRLYFVAHTGHDDGAARSTRCVLESEASIQSRSARVGSVSGVADTANDHGRSGIGSEEARVGTGEQRRWGLASGRADGELGHAQNERRIGRPDNRDEGRRECSPGQASQINGFWSACDWLPCTDGKARPVEPGTFPLVTGAPARLVRLRGYCNARNAEVATAFIEAYQAVERGRS